MTITPHINFGGKCEQAFRFYEQCLGGKIVTLKTWAETPMAQKIPAEWHAKISHASLKLGASVLAGVDNPYEKHQAPAAFQIILEIDEASEAERIFAKLAENGKVRMPVQKTFWADYFGVVVDQFEVVWEISSTAAASAA